MAALHTRTRTRAHTYAHNTLMRMCARAHTTYACTHTEALRTHICRAAALKPSHGLQVEPRSMAHMSLQQAGHNHQARHRRWRHCAFDSDGERRAVPACAACLFHVRALPPIGQASDLMPHL